MNSHPLRGTSLALVLTPLLVLGLSAAPGRPAYGQEAAGSKTVNGTFALRSGDPLAGSEHEHQYLYSVVDDGGEEHRLEIGDEVDRNVGGVRNLDTKRVRVRGALKRAARRGAMPAPEVIDASTIEVTQSASPPEGLTGSQKFATILCRFADSTGSPPKDSAYVNGLVGDAYPGISHFWRENSFNQINNLGSVVKGWYTLPAARSVYVPSSPPDFDRLAADCTAAADAEVNYNDFTGINLLFDQNLDCCAWGGSQWMTLDGSTRLWPMTWMPPWGYASQSVLAHEMGHAYGLPHSSGNYGAVYDSRWDVMSGGRGTADPTYGQLGTHTIAYHKDKLGWIPPARKYTPARNTCATVTIDHLSQVPATSGTYLMAQVPTTTNRFYTVEARRNNGYDGGRIPGEAIVIHDVLTTRAEPAHVVDATVDNNPNDAGAMWLPGETFSDAANGVGIEVLSSTANGWSVRISNGSCFSPPGAPTSVVATPGNASATLSWTPPTDGGSPITGYVITPYVGATAGVPRTVSTSSTIIDVITGLISNLITDLTNGTAVTFKVAATNAAGTGPQSAASNSVVPGATQDRYHALTPARVLDTRLGIGGFSAPVGSGATVAVGVTGTGGVPAGGVSAVAVNVTAVQPSAGGYLTVYPTGTSRPTASNVNFVATQTVGNLVVAKVGPDGKVAVFNFAGNTHVVFDVVGWYGADGGDGYNALTPARILDTRIGTGGFFTPVGSGATIAVGVTGTGGVPASGVSAVVVNVTAVQPSAPGYLTIHPTGTTRPTASNLNFAAGQTVGNLVVAKVGPDGKVAVFNFAGNTPVVFDVVGWYGAAGGAAYNALTPARILDTRLGIGGFSSPVGSAATIAVGVTGTGGVPASGVSAVVLNLTAVQPSAPGYLTIYPTGTVRPTASNLNFVANQTVPNLVVAKVGPDGKVTVFNFAGNTHVVFDVVGWFPA